MSLWRISIVPFFDIEPEEVGHFTGTWKEVKKAVDAAPIKGLWIESKLLSEFRFIPPNIIQECMITIEEDLE